ncbi:MAG: cytochrome B6 [Planctomycetota bacterium]|nr:cytochrome B6 [Planctomycetaceae bacterium]MDQ3330311.1 cytochrome B6 [Planctomycetota bacterium]
MLLRRRYAFTLAAGVAGAIAAGLLTPDLSFGQQRQPRPNATATQKPAGGGTSDTSPDAGTSTLPEGIDEKQSYLPVVVPDFETVRKKDIAERDKVITTQKSLLENRYDLRDDASDLPMSAGRKKVQQGVRVKLPDGVTWDDLAAMSPAEIKEQDAWPQGFRPLPHVKHATGGMVIRKEHIKAIQEAEHRSLDRFDVEFDLPEHLLPEFPPPIFLTNRPDLGDVSQGQVVTIKNFHELFLGKLTPFQLEGLRLLLTPFPQQQFNATGDRKVDEASLGISCFDCHTNGHTNASFHLNPDTRPQELRFRLDTPSLRGMFNQRIHGSKRSLRSVEDFTEFEQRSAYFDGDQVTAAKKGIHAPDRATSIAPMAQFQNMLDFPPAPKLDIYGKLDSEQASESERRGQELFFGKARCAECHPAPHYLDNLMHDLHVERFFEPKMVNGHFDHPAGPMKTMTLRGIKDSPPYLHDGRLLTLDDTVEFFNLIQGLKLNKQEKADLVAFLKTL